MAGAHRSNVGSVEGRSALSDTDTIFALSSGAPPAAIAIVRVSGAEAMAVAAGMAGELPPPRTAGLRSLRDRTGDLLDRALVLVFSGPASATGEDLVEFHCHGGRAVVTAIGAALAAGGARPAVAGEFTRRAWLNGRIDLAQAQGLADLLSAQSEAERRLAMAAAEGTVSRAIRGWMERMTAIAAEIEASIDFAAEGDVEREARSLATVLTARDGLVADMRAVLDAPPVERWRDGWRIVVTGPPNAGKSTLVNLLAGRDAAIVSPLAGTTRDRIEVSVQRNGVGYVLIDTAGLRDDADDPVERMGIERAGRAAAAADLILSLDDRAPTDPRAIRVHARSDLPGREVAPADAMATAATELPSIDRLWTAIEGRLLAAAAIPQVALHRDEQESCRHAVDAIGDAGDVVLLAEGIRRARRQLAAVLGIDAMDQLLTQIFSRFCVGK